MNMPAPRDRDDLVDRIRLLRTRNVGPVSFRQLVVRFGSAAAALERLPELSKRAGGASVTPPARTAAEAELAAAEAAGAAVLALGDPAYPAALAALEDAPPILFVLGDKARLNQPCVALVGARHASANGRTLAERMARDLGAAGYVVVSGLARGIDAAAHEGALASGTVAVLAGGLDKVYPEEHVPLAEAIVAHDGAVVTEMPLGQAPRAQHFPRRNRLVSGLSLGVVVVQAARRSGSLITARLAGEQGREVFAVPGFPLDERHQGCNQLLREGAILTEAAADVLAVLGHAELRETWPEPDYEAAAPLPEPAGDVETIAALLGPEPVPVDALIRRSGLTAPELLTILLDLELAGRLDRHSGSHVSLRL
ncbi:MAG: DNA-processing protein DprA [Alphaproteobacteria bacterium]